MGEESAPPLLLEIGVTRGPHQIFEFEWETGFTGAGGLPPGPVRNLALTKYLWGTWHWCRWMNGLAFIKQACQVEGRRLQIKSCVQYRGVDDWWDDW